MTGVFLKRMMTAAVLPAILLGVNVSLAEAQSCEPVVAEHCDSARSVPVGSKPNHHAPNAAVKTIAFLGDSNTWSGGEDCSRTESWSHHVAKRLHAQYARSFARSGATICNVADTRVDTLELTERLSDTNTLLAQAVRMAGAVERGEMPRPDIVFIAAGTNDCWFADRRPGLFDSAEKAAETAPLTHGSSIPQGASTLDGSVELLITQIRNSIPEARIVIVGIPLSTRTDAGMTRRAVDRLRAVARARHADFIAIDSDTIINPERERAGFEATRDGVHTNIVGARRIADAVMKALAESNSE